MITREAFAVIGKKVVPEPPEKPPPCMKTMTGRLFAPLILLVSKDSLAGVFAWHCRGGPLLKGILVRICEILSVHIEVRGILLWADSTVCKRVANPRPWFRFGCWHEAARAGGRSAVWYAFEAVNSVPLKSSNFARACLYDRGGVRTNDFASRTENCGSPGSGRRFRRR